MKENPSHGNRLRPPHEAYEVKKKRSRDRYAAMKMKLNPTWHNDRVLRDLVNLFGTGKEIPLDEYQRRAFDFNNYLEIRQDGSVKLLVFNKYEIQIRKEKQIIIWMRNF